MIDSTCFDRRPSWQITLYIQSTSLFTLDYTIINIIIKIIVIIVIIIIIINIIMTGRNLVID